MAHRLRLIALTLVISGAVAADEPATRGVDFSRDVRPILSDHCFACHGPDEKQRQADLRLDTADGLAGAVVMSDLERLRSELRRP